MGSPVVAWGLPWGSEIFENISCKFMGVCAKFCMTLVETTVDSVMYFYNQSKFQM